MDSEGAHRKHPRIEILRLRRFPGVQEQPLGQGAKSAFFHYPFVSNFEATIEVAHDCPFCRFTSKYQSSRITSWTNEKTVIAVVDSPEPKVLDAYEQEFSQLFQDSHFTRQDNRLEAIIPSSVRDSGSITNLIANNECWYMQPSVAFKGWETYRILSWKKENISKLVQDIRAVGGQVVLKSLREVALPCFCDDMIIPTATLLTDLTAKQLEILCDAFALGYFNHPAKIGVDELAKRAGLSRSTYSEHLRKAESKVLSNIYPVIRLACRRAEECDCSTNKNEN